jgi:hypothetical protein
MEYIPYGPAPLPWLQLQAPPIVSGLLPASPWPLQALPPPPIGISQHDEQILGCLHMSPHLIVTTHGTMDICWHSKKPCKLMEWHCVNRFVRERQQKVGESYLSKGDDEENGIILG